MKLTNKKRKFSKSSLEKDFILTKIQLKNFNIKKKKNKYIR